MRMSSQLVSSEVTPSHTCHAHFTQEVDRANSRGTRRGDQKKLVLVYEGAGAFSTPRLLTVLGRTANRCRKHTHTHIHTAGVFGMSHGNKLVLLILHAFCFLI